MIRAISVLLTVVAAAAGLGFVARYLGGYAGVFEHERIVLVPLIAGLGAAVLEGRRAGAVSRPAAAVSLGLLAVWAGGLILG
ncbi:MAG TPA: hypothetical protein VE959_27505 [Bryobacteraceae bacterium]|nr:hypothetical protein [Bryobacteraceae bacterium]